MHSRLFILVGIPGCGKTTWAQDILFSAHPVSSDAIRLELFGPVYDQNDNEAVFETFYDRIRILLGCEEDVVADATNLRDFTRQKLRDIAEVHKAETHLIVFQNLSQAIKRNFARTGVTSGDCAIPPADMVNMLERYEEAIRDIPLEQYTTVTSIGEFS